MKVKAVSVACAVAMTLVLVACGPPPGAPPTTTTTTTTIPAGSTLLVAGDTVALGQFPVGVAVDRLLSIPGGGVLTVTGGALPDGLELGTDGHLTGTPTTSTLFFIEVNDDFEAWGGVTTDDPDPLTNKFAYVPAAAPPKDVMLQTSYIGPFGGGISGTLVHEADGDVRPVRSVNMGFGPVAFEAGGGANGAAFGTLAFPTSTPCEIGVMDLTHGNPTGFVGMLEGLSLDSTNCEPVVSSDGSTLIVSEMGATDADWTLHFYASGSIVPDRSVEVTGVRSNGSVARDGSTVVLATVDPLTVSNSLVVVDRTTGSVTTVPVTDGGSPVYAEPIASQRLLAVHDGDTVGVMMVRPADSTLWLATIDTTTGEVDAVMNMFDDTITNTGGFADGSLVPVTQRAPDGSNTIGVLDLSTGSVTTLGNWTDNFFNYGYFLG